VLSDTPKVQALAAIALGVRFANPIVTPRENSSGHAQLALIHQEMEGLVGVLLNNGTGGHCLVFRLAGSLPPSAQAMAEKSIMH
jgi:hypothetical protein